MRRASDYYVSLTGVLSPSYNGTLRKRRIKYHKYAPPNEAHTIPVAQFDAAMKILQDALRD